MPAHGRPPNCCPSVPPERFLPPPPRPRPPPGRRRYVPLGMRGWFHRRGVENVMELDWWQEAQHPGSGVRSAGRAQGAGRGGAWRRQWEGGRAGVHCASSVGSPQPLCSARQPAVFCSRVCPSQGGAHAGAALEHALARGAQPQGLAVGRLRGAGPAAAVRAEDEGWLGWRGWRGSGGCSPAVCTQAHRVRRAARRACIAWQLTDIAASNLQVLVCGRHRLRARLLGDRAAPGPL